jgi:hypothetical protein
MHKNQKCNRCEDNQEVVDLLHETLRQQGDRLGKSLRIEYRVREKMDKKQFLECMDLAMKDWSDHIKKLKEENS